MKVTELRLAKLFSTKAEGALAITAQCTADVATTVRGNITYYLVCVFMKLHIRWCKHIKKIKPPIVHDRN